MKWRVIRVFGADIDPHVPCVYRVETETMMTQQEALRLMTRLNAGQPPDDEGIAQFLTPKKYNRKD